MLFWFIGNTGLSRTNVISLAYKLSADRATFTFAVTYSNANDVYSKQYAKHVLWNRISNDEVYAGYVTNNNISRSLLDALYAMQRSSTNSSHPVWARHMVRDLINGDKV